MKQPRFVPVRLFSVLRTLLLGLVFGALAYTVSLPLPWMLGPLLGVAALSLIGVRQGIPDWLRTGNRASIGLLLGANVTPETFDRVGQWSLSLFVMFGGLTILVGLSVGYYTRVAGANRLTAIAASLPGGLSNVSAFATDLGAHGPTVVVGQLLRMCAVVLIVPTAYALWLPGAATASAAASGWAVQGGNLWIIPLALPAYLLARWLRLPGAEMLGPLLLSGGLSVAGCALDMPAWLIALTFITLGVSIGSRFYLLAPRLLLELSLHGAVATALMMSGCLALAIAISLVAAVPIHVAFLAVAPGGMAEMSALAVVLGVDPAFVIFHQVTRNLVINTLAPLLLGRFQRNVGSKD